MDIVAAHTRSSFYLRGAIARADSLDALVAAARELNPMVIAMHAAGFAAASITPVYAVVVDALTRRLLELDGRPQVGAPITDFAWLALGSQARREPLPSSDIDSAIVWFGDPPRARSAPHLARRGEAVVAGPGGVRPAPRLARRDGR